MEELIPKKIRKIPRKKIVPIIHRKYAEPITELVKFWYLKISDKRCLSVLSVRAPSLPREFEHLKRINKGAFFLLEPVSENQKLSEEAVEAIEGIEGVALDIICVPGKAPLSKYQMDLIKDIWPVNFKPQFNIEKMMCGKLFDRTETDRILRFYDEVCVTDSIIIYDPMEYVVRVRIPKFQKCHEIDHPVMRALNELAIIQKKALSEGDCEQYLATNYYCILPTECCAMCTMALVHSRIGKVFFGDLIHEKGAFLSTWRMMECPKINHHFDLFRIVDDEDKFSCSFNWTLKVKNTVSITVYDEEVKEYSYFDLMKIKEHFMGMIDSSYKNCLIGIQMDRGIELIGAILGIIESGNAFIVLPNLSTSPHLNETTKAFEIAAIIGKKNIFPIHCNPLPWDKESNKIMYGITSSGTTGKAKTVHVPFSCILLNIYDLVERLKITEKDILMCSTSLSFDPSFIEIFVGLTGGSKLIIVPDKFRQLPKVMVNVLNKEKVTLFQTTPSVLKLFNSSELKELLTNSNLNHLLIGGEPFCYGYLKKVISPNTTTRTKVYDVYGITEVSCWATIKLIKLNEPWNNYDVGETLIGTLIHVDDKQNILIGGFRRCAVNMSFPFNGFTKSGDLMSETIGFLGRSKFNGQLRAYEVEDIACLVENVDQGKIIYEGSLSILFLFGKGIIVGDVIAKLKSELCPERVPIKTVHCTLSEWPVTINGKVDEKKLIEWYKSSNQLNLEWLFKPIKGYPLLNDITLHTLGITSLQAGEINYFVQEALPSQYPNFFSWLLSQEITVGELISFLEDNGVEYGNDKSKVLKAESICQGIDLKLMFKEKWSINMFKCIDANTMMLDDFLVCVGSHSGLFVIADLLIGSIYFQYKAKGRIEGNISCFDKYCAFGTYAGELIIINWVDKKLHGVFKTNSVIKCKPIFVGEHIYFGTYDKKVIKLEIESLKGNMIYEVDGCCLASGLIVGKTIIFTPLSNSIYCFNLENDFLVWKHEDSGPCFSDLTKVLHGKKEYLVECTVEGKVLVRSVDNGKICFMAKLSGQIYDSPQFVNEHEFIICLADGSISILKLENNVLTILKNIKVFDGARIVKCIRPFLDGYLGFTTNGKLWLISKDLDINKCIYDAKGEVFGVPTVRVTGGNIMIVFGSRDNYFKAIECTDYM